MGAASDRSAINMGANLGLGVGGSKPLSQTPFRILVLGDFSGRANQRNLAAGAELGKRKPRAIDRDNRDEILAALQPRLDLPVGQGGGGGGGGGATMTVSFSSLDDFHPDRLYERLEVFARLRQLRRRLADSQTFAAAASEIAEFVGPVRVAAPHPAAPPPPQSPAIASGASPPVEAENLLDLVVEGASEEVLEQAGARLGTRASEWDAVIGEIIAPYVLKKADPRQAEYLALIDEAIGAQMRAVLHHPDFQSLEAAWRGIDFLTRRAETDSGLKVYLLDVAPAEIAADLAAEDTRASGLYKLLVDQTVGTPGAQTWSLVVACARYGASVTDVTTVGTLTMLARAGGAPVIAEAAPSLVGCQDLARTSDPDDWTILPAAEAREAWQGLRQMPEAAWLALALPRILLRAPYGKGSDPVESFPFEEFLAGKEHEKLLWGNPALACTLALAEQFQRRGWKLEPGLTLDLARMPLFVFDDDGEKAVQPCAEVLLSERAADRVRALGLVAIQSIKGTDSVRVGGIQSIAIPSAFLAGQWGKG